MDRNMFFRIETCFPVTDPELMRRVKQDALLTYLADNRQSWLLQADGSYHHNVCDPGREKMAQQVLLERITLH
jgi:polyphosphate kinase